MLKQKCKLLKQMHETEKQDVRNGFYISITSDVKVGEALLEWSKRVAPSSNLLLLFLQWWKWAKRGSQGESSSRVS